MAVARVVDMESPWQPHQMTSRVDPSLYSKFRDNRPKTRRSRQTDRHLALYHLMMISSERSKRRALKF